MFLPDTAIEPNIRFSAPSFTYRAGKIMDSPEVARVVTTAGTVAFRLVLEGYSSGEPEVSLMLTRAEYCITIQVQL